MNMRMAMRDSGRDRPSPNEPGVWLLKPYTQLKFSVKDLNEYCSSDLHRSRHIVWSGPQG